MPIVDEEEEALDRARCTIAAPQTRTPTHGPGFVSHLVPFMGVSPIMREPAMAPNPAGGWTPPLQWTIVTGLRTLGPRGAGTFMLRTRRIYDLSIISGTPSIMTFMIQFYIRSF